VLDSPRGILNALESAASGIPAKDAVRAELPGPVSCDFFRDSINNIKRYDEAKAEGLCIDCPKQKGLQNPCHSFLEEVQHGRCCLRRVL
jgi:hypothetical protein